MLSTTTPPSPDAARARKRERERWLRQRRQAKAAARREMLETLERAVPVILTLDGSDDIQWDGFLDARALRVRKWMKHTLQLTREAQQLRAANGQLNQLLAEHRLAALVVSERLEKAASGNWEHDTRRWRLLAMQHFDPWTRSACLAAIHAGQTERANYQWHPDTTAPDTGAFGWRDLRNLDRQKGVLQFHFKKTFRGLDVMQYVDSMWDVYTEKTAYQAIVAGPHVRGYHHVLQRLGPDMVIVHGGLRFPENLVDSHLTYIAHRTKTDRGFVQHIRAIECPELKNVFAGATNMWFSHSAAYHWTPLKNDEHGYTLRVEGSFGGSDVNFVDGWMQMLLECTLRSEIAGTGRQLIMNV